MICFNLGVGATVFVGVCVSLAVNVKAAGVGI